MNVRRRQNRSRSLIETFLAVLTIFSLWNLTFIYRKIDNEHTMTGKQSTMPDISFASNRFNHLNGVNVDTIRGPRSQSVQKTRRIFNSVEYDKQKKSAMIPFHNVTTVGKSIADQSARVRHSSNLINKS